MTPEIPKGWEKCELQDAECGFVVGTGNMYPLNVNKCLQMPNASPIFHGSFERLGITPVRKVQPIEFVVAPQGQPANGFPQVEGIVYDKIPASWIGKTFREVIE